MTPEEAEIEEALTHLRNLRKEKRHLEERVDYWLKTAEAWMDRALAAEGELRKLRRSEKGAA